MLQVDSTKNIILNLIPTICPKRYTVVELPGGCLKPFTGVVEHGRLVKGRSKLLKSDEK
jgi:hypothetical protein